MKKTLAALLISCVALARLGYGAVAPLKIEAFTYGTETEKLSVLKELVKQKNKVYLPKVGELLGDPSKEVRSAAMQTLLAIGDGTCTPYFSKGLQDPWWQVRLNAMRGLVRHGQGDIIPDFLKGLDDSYWQVRCYAAVGLGKYGDEEVLLPLLQHLKDGNQDVGEEILWALDRLMWRDQARADFKRLPPDTLALLAGKLQSKELPVKIRTIWVLQDSQDERVVPFLVRALDDENTEVKIRALWALESLKATDARQAVEGLLEDSSTKVKIETIRTLVRLQSKDTLDGLIRRLKDPVESVKIYALWALERINDPVTYPEITACIASSSPRVSEYAVRIIETKRSPVFFPSLQNLAASEDSALDVRVTALQLLGTIGDASVKPFLAGLAKTENPVIRKQALQSLYRVDKLDADSIRLLVFTQRCDSDPSVRKASAALLEGVLNQAAVQLKNPDQSKREETLGKTELLVEAPGVTKLMREMARSRYPEVREQMAVLAAKAPDSALAAGLRELFREPGDDVKKEAARALGAVKDRRAIPLLKQGLESGDTELRLECALALARMGDASGLAAADAALRTRGGGFQTKAIETIACLKAKSSSDILLRLLNDSELETKLAAAWALARLGEKKGLEVLVRLSEQNVEPVRTQANRYLEDTAIPSGLRACVPALREQLRRQTMGIQEATPRAIKAVYASSAPTTDGNDSDRLWRLAESANAFLLLGPEKVPAGVQTRVAVGYDDKNLYVLFVCDDPETGSLTMNSRDFVTVSLNPKNSLKEWYQFVVHPFNHIHYAYVWKLYTDGDPARQWNAAWQSAVSRQANRWTAEITVPLADLKTDKPGPGTEWNINFARESGKLPLTAWTGRIDNPPQFGVLVFEERK